ncbi:MAG: murein L,D-transpeptidase catalytic domain-containing protein [Longimicrobiales bacterium]
MRRLPLSRLSAIAVIILSALTAAAAIPLDRAEAATGGHRTDALKLAGPTAAAELAVLSDDAAMSPPVREPDSDSAVVASADAALRALASRVKTVSHSAALRTAFQAYYNYRLTNPEAVRKPYLYYVDMGLDNRTPRGYVFDMDRLTLVDGPFAVAHGRGSARTRDAVPTSFSNRPGSKATSLGLYLAQETYSFNGKLAGRRYSSVGLRMRGESGQFNSAARGRGIVAHGAPYVSRGQAGRSEGCPAMEMARAKRILPMIANGGVVFIYSPNDRNWLRNDPWLLDG